MNEHVIEAGFAKLTDRVKILLWVGSEDYIAGDVILRHPLGKFFKVTRQRQFETGLAFNRGVRPDLQRLPACLCFIARPANRQLTEASTSPSYLSGLGHSSRSKRNSVSENARRARQRWLN